MVTPLIEFMRLLCEARTTYKVQVFAKHKKWALLWRAIAWLFRVTTFGRFGTFYTRTTTTIGPYIFFPAGWESKHADLVDCAIFQHETEHVKWFYRAGLGNPWLGVILIGLLYLLFPLPVGFAWFRYAMERVAYRESIRAWKRYGVSMDLDYYTDTLAGPAYFWPWPKKWVSKWFRENP